MKNILQSGCLLVTCGVLLTGCVGVVKNRVQDVKDEENTAFGLIKVQTTGPYSRGFETQLRFFHLLNVDTQERIRVDIQSSATAFGLPLSPGEYEVIRVQINEGPMMMESHVSWRFQVPPNRKTYLGTWTFDVDTPRTQRMLRMDISQGPSNWDEMFPVDPVQNDQSMVVALPQSLSDEVRLYTVAPNPKISYYYR